MNMDFYGYTDYQYTQSDELARQMFAHQALASSMPYNRGITDPHMMPAPTGSPWNMQGISWGMQSPPNLVHFTAQACNDPKASPVIHCKRKSFDVEPVIPTKQLITEEKMAAHLNGLHISSDYTPHSFGNEHGMDIGMEAQNTSVCDRLKGHTIVLSEELKKLKEEPLLPAALIERLEKPQMSLVVWKPKENILTKLREIEDDKSARSDPEEEESKRRNGVLVAEPNGMDVEM